MTTLDLLAPDQRAVLELVLRQDRSYGELAELLGISERHVRERADAALRALAGAPEDDVDSGRITDWLLGQQTDRAAAATRAQLERSERARAWAALAAGRLREVGGERVPGVPAAASSERGKERREPDPAPAPPRPRPLRDAPPAAAAPTPAPRSSRLGGAVLIGVVALALAGFLVWFLTRGDDDSPRPAPARSAAASATPQASNALEATSNDVLLQGVGGNGAEGLMRLFKAQGGGVQFAIGAQGLPNNRKGEFYAVWFTKRGGAARLLGFPQTAVTNGVLTVGGPGKGDERDFPRWFATYDKVLITRETKAHPRHPGSAVLEGTLPHAQGG